MVPGFWQGQLYSEEDITRLRLPHRVVVSDSPDATRRTVYELRKIYSKAGFLGYQYERAAGGGG